MPETRVAHRPPAVLPDLPDPHGAPRPNPWWAAAAAALVLVVVGGVLLMGRIPLPEFPDLAVTPDSAIPGVVAAIEYTGGQTCVVQVAAGGGPAQEVACYDEGLEGLAWTADGDILLLTYGETGAEVLVVEPDSGETLRRIDVPEGIDPWRLTRDRDLHDGSRLITDLESRGHAVLRVRTEQGTRQLLDVDGPLDYGFDVAQWSPDGAWILLSDTRGRLLVLGADGSPGPRVLIDVGRGAPTPAWYVPGETMYTADPDDL